MKKSGSPVIDQFWKNHKQHQQKTHERNMKKIKQMIS